MNKPDENCPARVANDVIAAIIDLYGDEAGQSGVVEPNGAIEGLCLAIALAAHSTVEY